MAYPIHGKVARVDKDGTLIAETIAWTVTTNLDLAEVTAQGDDWKSFIAGTSEWDATVDCMLDPSNTEQKALLDNIVAATPGVILTGLKFMLEDTGDYFSGNVILMGFPTKTDIGDKVLCTFTFKGTAALSYTQGA